MNIVSVGIDLGKTTFHLVALDDHGKVVVRKKFSRNHLLAYTANLQSSLIGMEACAGAHFIGAALRDQGHDVRIIPAQFVKPYVKSNKNDFIDAEAIAEAVTRQNMRFVPIKTEDQLDLQALHRIRECLVQRRTALINQIRGFLLERGISFAKGLPADGFVVIRHSVEEHGPGDPRQLVGHSPSKDQHARIEIGILCFGNHGWLSRSSLYDGNHSSGFGEAILSPCFRIHADRAFELLRKAMELASKSSTDAYLLWAQLDGLVMLKAEWLLRSVSN